MGRGNGSTVDISGVLNAGSSKIKKKMRDIRRLLAKGNLPSDITIANERALKTLEMELENVQLNQKAKKMHTKYQKVRFFEKKKAVRHYKAAVNALSDLEKQKKNAEDDAAKKEIKAKIKEQKKALDKAAVEFAYVLNYPLTEKYVALYAKDPKPETLSEKAQKGLKLSQEKRKTYKKLFKDKLKNGTLEISLEAGLKGNQHLHVSSTKKIDATEHAPTSNKIEQNVDEEDDFFE